MLKFLNHTLEIRNSIPEDNKYLLCCTCCKDPIMLTVHEVDLKRLTVGTKYCYSFDNHDFVGEYDTIEEIILYFKDNSYEAISSIIYIGEYTPVKLSDVFNPYQFISDLQDKWVETYSDLFDWPFSDEEDEMITAKVATCLDTTVIDNLFTASNIVAYNLEDF